MHQSWLELLFSHWPIAPETLRPLVPDQLAIDTFDGSAWIGVVPFHMSNIHPRGIPALPGISAFPELNVRTYVSVQGIPGVYFFSLDAGNPLAVAIARSIFHLPYFRADMASRTEGDTISYRSRRTHRQAPPADYQASYRPVAPAQEYPPDSLEAWFTERYALYTVAGSQLYRGDIHHVRWSLQVAELETVANTMALSHGIYLPDTPPLLHYAQRQDVLIWPLCKVAL
jgi:uncharacterized protein YqjF (DUF2071 family)